jgi:hypothetical protein
MENPAMFMVSRIYVDKMIITEKMMCKSGAIPITIQVISA